MSTPAGDLRETLQQAITDLAEVARQLPGANAGESGRAAAILDRASEETADAAAMTRALPGRPPRQPGHTFAAAAAISTAAKREPDFAAWLTAVLRATARAPGTPLTSSPAGNWEAWLLRQLIHGQPAAGPAAAPTATREPRPSPRAPGPA